MADKSKEKRKPKNDEPRFRLRRLAYEIVGLMVLLALAATILGSAITPDSYDRIGDGIFVLLLIFLAAAGMLIIASVRTYLQQRPMVFERREWLEMGLICLLVTVTFLLMLEAMMPAVGMIFSNITTCCFCSGLP